MPFVRQEELDTLDYAFSMLAKLCEENNVNGFHNFAIKVGDKYFPRNATGVHLSKREKRKRVKSVNTNIKQLTINEHTNSEG
jgi:hypothetical protein